MGSQKTSSLKGASKKIERACDNCHGRKVKCSGTQPCEACRNSKTLCQFKPKKPRKLEIDEDVFQALRADSEELKRRKATAAIEDSQIVTHPPIKPTPVPFADNEPVNPLLENKSGLFSGQESSEPVYVGEGSCTAYGDRILQCMDDDHDSISSNTIPNYWRHPVCNRLLATRPRLPDRGQANVLIWRALKFIGNDYHLCLRVKFFQQLDQAYAVGQPHSLHWACQLFVLLAIGEMYSHAAQYTDGSGKSQVPGSAFFVQAVSLMQDSYEEPSIEQVQSILLLSFYANVLGCVKRGHVYSGIAMRLAISLGLHRTQLGQNQMNPVHRENRRRVWWTLYLFDRMTASKLGYPLAIQDDDIDVEMPSLEGLSDLEKGEFAEPQHLCANVRLAKITGKILNDINGLPRRFKRPFLHRAQRILNDLKRWEIELPPHLRMHSEASRGVHSLHMLYNLCIIQTTRPALLLVFKSRVQTVRSGSPVEAPDFPPYASILADSCVQAARTLNQILSRLFISGTLAVFGFFDTHYLFSSTLVLLMSSILEPTPATSNAIQTALYLLRLMSNSGNVAAGDYLNRLEQVQATLNMFSSSIHHRGSVDATAIPGSQYGMPEDSAHGHDLHAWLHNPAMMNVAVPGEGFGDDNALEGHDIEQFLDGDFGMVDLPMIEDAIQEFTTSELWGELADARGLGPDPLQPRG